MIAGAEYAAAKNSGSVAEVLSQFCGKVIGSPARGSIHNVIIRYLLSRYQIDRVEVRNFPWADLIPAAIAEGEIQGAVGTPQLAVVAQTFYSQKIILRPQHIWPFNPSYGIVIRDNLLGDSELLKVFLQTHEKACNFLREKPQDAAELLAKESKAVNRNFILNTLSISSGGLLRRRQRGEQPVPERRRRDAQAGHRGGERGRAPCVREPARQLVRDGWKLREIAADGEGRVDLADYGRALAEHPRPVSVMLANNETGVIQPIPALAARARGVRAIFHTDAVQALGKIKVDFRALGAHALTVSAHKLNGPQGAAAVVVDKRVEMRPLIAGGGQERGLRSGTENVAAIAGFGRACELATAALEQNAARTRALRESLERGLTRLGARIFGAWRCASPRGGRRCIGLRLAGR